MPAPGFASPELMRVPSTPWESLGSCPRTPAGGRPELGTVTGTEVAAATSRKKTISSIAAWSPEGFFLFVTHGKQETGHFQEG